ncbi:hypothetical protein MMC34_008342 [Xylographa carneopallida]|nr:hypothetical protein [Xylographa carneopallida]
MQISSFTAAFGSLLCFHISNAAVLDARSTTCNANNCLRAIVASSHTPGPASASKDCSSFLKKTVTPATVTSTATVYVTTTASTATLTNVNTIQATTLETIQITTVPTIQITTLETAVPVQTVLATVLTTITDDVTVTVLAKRAVSASGMRHMLDYKSIPLEPRQMTVAPSSIPAYASACSGTSQYSSACSCIGVTPTTTTVAAPTTTTTKTITVTNTATSIIQASTTVENTILTTVITTIPTTIVTTIITTIPTTDIITTTVPVTVDVTATVLACGPTPTFFLQVVGAGATGEYASVSSFDGGFSDQVISLVTAIAGASPFSLDAAGHLVTGGSIANIDDVPAETIFFDTAAQLAGGGEDELVCTLPASGAGLLACVAGSDGDSIIQLCPAGALADGEYPIAGVAIANTLEPGCQALAFEAIPLCV